MKTFKQIFMSACVKNSSREKIVRAVAGTFILASTALTVFVSINWLWFTVFVGVNLIQSTMSNWCLLETILDRLHIATNSPAK